MKSVTAKRIITIAIAIAIGARSRGPYLSSISSGWVSDGRRLIRGTRSAIAASAMIFGATKIQIDPVPMKRNIPVTRNMAPAVSHDAAADIPMFPAPISLPAIQKSVIVRCFFAKCHPTAISAATYIISSAINVYIISPGSV